MQKALDMSMVQTKKIFLTIFLFAHGYASIIANNAMKYDKETVRAQLEQAYRGGNSGHQGENGRKLCIFLW